ITPQPFLAAESGCDLGGELAQIVDPELLLDFADLLHFAFESFFAEQLVLFGLELLAQGVEFVLANDAAQRRKQNRVLARFVRAIHANELLNAGGQPSAIAVIGKRLRFRKLLNLSRKLAAGGMLRL